MSFARLVQRIKDGLAPETASQPSHEERLKLATATVLLDIAYADGTLSPAEGGNVVEYLQKTFSLGEGDVSELIEAAQEIRDHTIDHFAMTNYIRKNVPLEDRIEIVRTMWRTAYADGNINQYENYMVRKLAGLLGLEHHVMIDAKVSVLRELEAT